MSTALAHLPPEQLRQFDPLQLVRLWLQATGPSRKDKSVSFRADLGAAFPGRPLCRVTVESQGERLRLETPDFCVASALGPLPEPFVEWLREQDADGHGAMRAFLDLFNHRLHLLRYGMRAEFEPGLNSEPPARTPLASFLAALMGMRDGQALARVPLPERSWLGIGGLLCGARRSAAALAQVLQAHLGCPVRVEQLVGNWRPIEAQDTHRLGQGGRRLGQDTLLGSKVWDAQGRVRLHIGPLPFALARRLLPPDTPHASSADAADPAGSLHTAFTALVHLMLDRRQDAEVHIQVQPQTVDASRARSSGGPGLRLGQTGWLQSRSHDQPRHMRFVISARGAATAP